MFGKVESTEISASVQNQILSIEYEISSHRDTTAPTKEAHNMLLHFEPANNVNYLFLPIHTPQVKIRRELLCKCKQEHLLC